MSRQSKATVRSVRDRTLRAQQTYLLKLRESLEALQPLLEEADADAVQLARALESEVAHLTYGTALVEG